MTERDRITDVNKAPSAEEAAVASQRRAVVRFRNHNAQVCAVWKKQKKVGIPLAQWQ
ncbi:hypothetical protein [Escherichia coli]|uniref:hypothetical protein n=1 Tax=Escherichia coli TaxID=562 RepID=UPI002542F609|nr:hypothetical protein [Escherichia coli]